MLKINLENWEDCKEDIKTLIYDHWKEVAWYQDKMSLDPVWDKYDVLDTANILHCFVIRNEEGIIAGYAAFFLLPSLHYAGNVFAENDVMYITPAYRGGTAGVELLNYCTTALQSMGVDLMTIKMKTDNTFHRLMDACDFQQMEFVYTKWIGG